VGSGALPSHQSAEPAALLGLSSIGSVRAVSRLEAVSSQNWEFSEGGGDIFFELGGKGIFSKRIGSPYGSGRSAHWVMKVKNPNSSLDVGFAPPQRY
jgi:hypothetical protein